MDLRLLADAVTIFLAPALPFLVSGGEKVVAEAGKKIGEDGLEMAKKLWGKLRPKVEEKPIAEAAAQEVANAPEDPDAQAALRLQVKRILEEDASLASEIAKLVEEAGPRTSFHAEVHGSGAVAQGPGSVAAGAGGVAAGRDIHGGVRIGGKNS